MELLATAPTEDRAPLGPGVGELSAEFRGAIMACDHSRAQELASDYVEALRTLWESMPAEQPTASELLEEARKLLIWAQQATMIQRRLTSDQLAILHRASSYRQSTPSPSLQVKA